MERRACGDHVPSLSVRFGSLTLENDDKKQTRYEKFGEEDLRGRQRRMRELIRGKNALQSETLPFFICCQSYLLIYSKLNWCCNIEVMCRRWPNGKAKTETKLTNFIKVKRKI